MKKVLASFVIFCLLASQVMAANFSDVSDTYIYSREIQYLKDNSISQGFSDGTYKPENPITRAELTSLVVKSVFGEDYSCSTVEELQTSSCQDNIEVFPDVPLTDKFAPSIYKARAEGILQGFNDGTFKPANNITFAESAKIIINSIDEDFEGISEPLQFYLDKLTQEEANPPTITAGDGAKIINRGEIAFLIRAVRENYNVLEPLPTPTYEFIIKRGQQITMPEVNMSFSMRNHGIHCSSGYTFIDIAVAQNGSTQVLHLERSCTGFYGDGYIAGESTHEADAFGKHFVLAEVQEVVTYEADTFEYTIQLN